MSAAHIGPHSAAAASAEMPRYQCHKKVWALKIGLGLRILPNGDIELEIADEGFAPIVIDRSLAARHWPRPGDYYVVYDDGYKSLSPAKAFEEGYTKIHA